MAARIVTQELVDQAAAQLLAEGQEPTIILVQERVGGGSYSTVKRHLDVWKTAREQLPVVVVPSDIATSGSAFVAQLWAAALAQAAQQTQQARAEAAQQVAAAQQQLAIAEAAIARLEAALDTATTRAAEQAALLDELQRTVDRAQAEQRSAEVQAQVLEQQVTQLQDDLRGERAALAAAHARELAQAQLHGELVALRQQLADQHQLIERLSGGAKA